VTRNHIGGVMNRVLAPSAVYRGFEPWSGQILAFISFPLNTQH